MDNGSQDGTPDYIQRFYKKFLNSKLKIFRLSKNHGWPGGNNRGALLAKDVEFILFLNDDVIVEKNLLKELINSMIQDNTIGAIQPIILNPDGSIQTAGFFINKLLFSYAINFKPTKIMPIVYASGSALFVKREIFIRLGLFDENLFLYNDDLDFGLRVWLYGYKCVTNPKVQVYHFGGQKNYRQMANVMYYIVGNSIYVMGKYYPYFQFILLITVYIFIVISIAIYKFFTFQKLIALSMLKGIFRGLNMLPKALKMRQMIKQCTQVNSIYPLLNIWKKYCDVIKYVKI